MIEVIGAGAVVLGWLFALLLVLKRKHPLHEAYEEGGEFPFV
jgi:hypothetical protein